MSLPRYLWWTVAGACLAAIIVFGPTLQYSFVNYDDPEILQKNDDVLNFDIGNILFKQSAYDYIPVTLLSFAIENKIFGLNPTIYHLDNLLFHLINIVLLALFLFTLFPEKPLIGILGTFVFAIHPLQVESVAWITQRKNVIYVMFYLLALLSYCEKRLWPAGIFFVLSVMAKATAITLPFLFLLIDFLQRGRLEKRDIKAKWPFFLISLGVAVIHLQMHGTDVHLKKSYTILDVGHNFFSSLTFYISKCFLPLNLAPYYEKNVFAFHWYDFAVTIAAVLFAIVFVTRIVKNKKDKNICLFGIGLFILTLGPTLQLVPFGNYFLYADRYIYFPIIGMAIFLAIIFEQVKKEDLRQFSFIAIFVLIGAMVISSYNRQVIWKDSITLWESQIETYPRTELAYFNLGGAYLFENNNAEKSIPYYQKALEIDPTYVEAVFNWGLALNSLKKEREALEKFEQVIKMANVGKAYLNAGILWQRFGNLDRAIEYFKAGTEREPKIAKAWELLASAYQAKGMMSEALEAQHRAISSQ